MKPLRSLLIMPANRADMLAKSPTYGADALVFDLEDSVPVAEKPKAACWRVKPSKSIACVKRPRCTCA